MEKNNENTKILNKKHIRENDKNLPLIDNENNKENNNSENLLLEPKDYYPIIKKKLIFILNQSCLELSNSKNPQILNCDDDIKILKKMKKNFDLYRPDITHQCLLSLFDSPLNKVGLLKVYIKTKKNIFIEINNKTRIPRTFKRFIGLFSQLLKKGKIQNEKNENLLNIINFDNKNFKNFPKIFVDNKKGRLIDIENYCNNINKNLKINNNIVFIINVDVNDIKINEVYKEKDIQYDDIISLSSYKIPSNIECSKICEAFEKIWEIL